MTISKIIVHIGQPSHINVKIKGLSFTDDAPKYDGPYSVVPKAYEATELKTKGTMLIDNITVFEVPYRETDNGYGNTVYIG